MKKILLIDDDQALVRLLGQYLERAGYQIYSASDGREGLRQLYVQQPDLVILDVMMPQIDGWETAQRIRELTNTALIMLTAKGEERDRLRGFRLGVDDYVIKPFSFAELTARVGAVLQRSAGSSEPRAAQAFVSRGLVIDFDRHLVLRYNEPVDLTATEFKLLRVLAENAGRVLSQEYLLEQVWGAEYAGDVGYIRRYIWYLRQKIEEDPHNPRYIITERGFGYSFRKGPEPG